MIELWDDFIGVPRPEGQETRKASLGTLDTVAPEVPELDSDYSLPSADDFEGLGFPTISTVPLVEDNTKSFGIFGLDGAQGYDFNDESFAYYVSNYGVDGINSPVEYAEKTCRPSIMYVSINIADKDYTSSAGDSTTLTFGAHEPNEDIRSLIEDITFAAYPDAD